eukprot:1902483-Amphidinium_carterae.1
MAKKLVPGHGYPNFLSSLEQDPHKQVPWRTGEMFLSGGECCLLLRRSTFSVAQDRLGTKPVQKSV